MYCSSIFVFICVILYLEVMIMVVKYYFAMSCCNQWWFQQYCIVIVFQSIAILWYFKFSKYCNTYCKKIQAFQKYVRYNDVLCLTMLFCTITILFVCHKFSCVMLCCIVMLQCHVAC